MSEHEPERLSFAELRSGDSFRIPGDARLYAKVHQRYIEVGKIGSRSIDGHVPVELVARHQERVPKDVELD